MDRSLAARVARPFGGPSVSRRRGARSSTRRVRTLRELPLAGLGALGHGARAPLASIWRRPRGRIALLSLLGCMPLLAGGWLLLRQSPFVSVQQVRIAGVSGPDAGVIEGSLVTAARRMSTLDVNDGALRAAVAGYPMVSAIRATPRFPHGLSIEVVEQQPVATLAVGGSRTAVAADGAVLGSTLASSSLPTVGGYRELAIGESVHDAGLLAILTVLGAAPAPMERAIAHAYIGAQGLTLQMRNGLRAYFGDAARPHAKWLSLDSVLADSSSQGASYVDVRIPGRPAAGFPAGVTPPDQSTTETAPVTPPTSTSEATVASIAATLAASNNGTVSSTPSPSESTSQSPAATGEASSETAQAPATSEAEASTESSQGAASPTG
jgi:cell division protein FtsQ